MNKSKFLKKSLAMILSVLMIVAMIPLGASAANTTLQAIYINGVSVSVKDGAFTADVTDTDVSVFVTGLYEGEEAYVDDVKVSDPGKTVDLTAYTPSSGVYTLPLTLVDGNGKTADYSIKLSLVAKRTTTELATVKATVAFGATISGRNINVTVPRGYNGEGTLTLTTKEGAKVNGDNPGPDGTYTLANYYDGQTVLVVAEAGGNQALYTVRLTERAILTSFQAGSVTATINNDDDEITATYPASVLVTPPTEKNPPAAAMATTFTVPAGTTVKLGDAVITSGKDQNYFDVDTGKFKTGVKLTVIYGDTETSENVKNEYDIVFGTELDTANTIFSATVDGETATVSGTKITANVQKNAATATVCLVAPAAATVALKDKAGNPVAVTTEVSNGDGTKNVIVENVAIGTLKEGVIIVVTSEAGVNKQYELVVTATGDVDTTELTSFALRIGGETYTGSVNKTARTVSVTVPYLTTDAALKTASVIATTNPYVMACGVEDGTTAVDKAEEIGLTAFGPAAAPSTATGTIWAVAKSGSKPATKYTVTVKLDTAKTGNTLSSVVISSAHTWNDLSNDNTYNGSIKNSSDGNTVTFRPAYSECQAASKDMYLKSIAASNGGVIFMGSNEETITGAPKGQLSDYFTVKTPEEIDETDGPFITIKGEDVNTDAYIIVLPETEARKQLNGGTPDISKGKVYEIQIVSQEPKTGTALSNVKFDTTTMGSSLTATIPYSMTNTIVFADDFNVSTGATLGICDPTDVDESLAVLVKGGAKDATGTALEPSAANGAFYFERQDDGTVKVYGVTDKENPTKDEVTHMYVLAEDGQNRQVYKIGTIKYAQPNTEAQITAFSLAGVAGKITSTGYDNWKIDVTVPLGTDVTILVPTFTASAGAAVYNGTPSSSNVLTSGEGSIDFSKPVVLTVVSEDGGKTNTYTVNVTVSDGFNDVPTNAWFYNNVMAAYNAGYVSGNGDGTFAPNASVTRRDFAVMVWNMLGKPAPTTTVSFKDVREEGYEVAAIAYLKENDIVSGDGDTGNFRPTATITRQEAACIVANAKELTGTSATKFNDDAKIASWASAKVYACYAAGVLNGDKDTGNFRPTDNISRAEAATIVLQAASK